ncbi:MAG: EamA family transporter, partial [Clostridiales bacterium]|nr:EamA family transporter [Clostridiales bacterium]
MTNGKGYSAAGGAVVLALLAALCYGLSVPLGRLLLEQLSPTFLAALLYLGAALAMLPARLLRQEKAEARLARADLPYVAAMVALDIPAPILLLFGLHTTAPATASLLSNFEIVATALVALFLFREAIGRRMWLAIGAITLASAVLSLNGLGGVLWSPGALLVLLACVCWGVENNMTNRLSLKNPADIVLVKGLGARVGALVIAVATGAVGGAMLPVALALLLGSVSYGLSILLYIRAQRSLGAARTSAYYAVAPFIGMAISFVVFREPPSASFFIALPLMVLGAVLAVTEHHAHRHRHAALTHTHRHSHADGHHEHAHAVTPTGEHSHPHAHTPVEHAHPPTPDAHHRH